jgi:hypothetical protein
MDPVGLAIVDWRLKIKETKLQGRSAIYTHSGD